MSFSVTWFSDKNTEVIAENLELPGTTKELASKMKQLKASYGFFQGNTFFIFHGEENEHKKAIRFNNAPVGKSDFLFVSNWTFLLDLVDQAANLRTARSYLCINRRLIVCSLDNCGLVATISALQGKDVEVVWEMDICKVFNEMESPKANFFSLFLLGATIKDMENGRIKVTHSFRRFKGLLEDPAMIKFWKLFRDSCIKESQTEKIIDSLWQDWIIWPQDKSYNNCLQWAEQHSMWGKIIDIMSPKCYFKVPVFISSLTSYMRAPKNPAKRRRIGE